MHTTPPEQVILKQDVLGRVRRSATQREQLLDEFERSGLSGRKFAALAGVNYQTFATWAQRRRQQRGAYPIPKAPTRTTAPVRWLEAVVTSAHDAEVKTNPAGLVLQLPGGARLELREVRQIPLAAALVRALEKPC
jgi:transposase